MQHLGDNEVREGRKDKLHQIVSNIRNDHLPSAPKRPNQPLGEQLGTGTNKVRWSTGCFGGDQSQTNIHERNGFVVWSVESFVGVKTIGDSAIELFGSGVEDDLGHVRFVREGSDKYDKGWASAGSRTEGGKKSPGQEQREEGVDSD